MKTQIELQNEIQKLEEKILNSTNKYKTNDLKEKISWLKAEMAGKFVTVEDLKELKSLIIYIICDWSFICPSQEDLKEVMTTLLNKVNENKIVFRTEKGKKNVILDAVKMTTKIYNENRMKMIDPEFATASTLENKTKASFEKFYVSKY